MLSDIIKKARKNKKLSQRQLAELIGISTSYIQQIELNQKTNPSTDIKFQLAKILDIPFKDLGLHLYVLPNPDINDIFPGIGEKREDSKEHDPVEELKKVSENNPISEKELILNLLEHYNSNYCNNRYDLSKVDNEDITDLKNMIYISIKTVLKNYQK